MAYKTKIAELEKAIQDKTEELKQAQETKQETAGDITAFVLAEKQEKRISEQIKVLKAAKQAVEYIPPEPTDKEELLSVFNKYYDAKSARIQKITEEIKAAENRLAVVNRGLHLAAVEVDTEKTVELSKEKADLEKKLAYLNDMLNRVKASRNFSNAEALKEWEGICKKVKPDFDNAVLRLETLAAEYKAACSDFFRLYDTLKSVRNAIKSKEAAEGLTPSNYPQILTVGLDTSKLTVNKGDYSRFNGIFSPLIAKEPL